MASVLRAMKCPVKDSVSPGLYAMPRGITVKIESLITFYFRLLPGIFFRIDRGGHKLLKITSKTLFNKLQDVLEDLQK